MKKRYANGLSENNKAHHPNLAIIQARMASKRLPGKALLKVGDFPLIHHVIKRGQKIRGVNQVILATSVAPENDELTRFAQSLGIDVHRGDEDDVIGRFYSVAKKHDAANIVRLTGDNPLLDFKAIGFLLQKHLEEESDYSCIQGLPVGVGADIFSMRGLSDSQQFANGKELSDHVDLYLLENQANYKLISYRLTPTLSQYRLTIDDQEDFSRIQALINKIGPRIYEMTTTQILKNIELHNLKTLMQPQVANISKQNQYTAQLVSKIEKTFSISAFD